MLDITEELFKDIPGYEGLYQVSNLGQIKSIGRIDRRGRNKLAEKIFSPVNTRNGYLQIKLHLDGKAKGAYIHRLVAATFISNPLKKPQVNHMNGNKLDNRAGNLEWCSAKENTAHAIETGLRQICRSSNGTSKLTSDEVRSIRKLYADGAFQKDLGNIFKVSQKTISNIILCRNYTSVL